MSDLQASPLHRRGLAFFIDLGIMGMFTGVVAYISMLILLVLFQDLLEGAYLSEIALQLLAHWLLHLIFWMGPMQATLGQRFMGLRVEWGEKRVSVGRVSARFFLKAFAFPVGWVTLIFHPQRRCLWDLICDSQVVVDPDSELFQS